MKRRLALIVLAGTALAAGCGPQIPEPPPRECSPTIGGTVCGGPYHEVLPYTTGKVWTPNL